MQNIKASAYSEPFPHIIYHNFYDDQELELIWEELNFLTKPGKLVEAKDYGGVVGYTNAKALFLDQIYRNHSKNDGDGPNYRSISNILTVNRKLFLKEVMHPFCKLHPCCSIASRCNHDVTKVRYYHDGEYYDPHTDRSVQFLGFSYFYKEPKRFEGGELCFPQFNYKLACENNSMIILPGWVEHGVTKVSIDDSDYFEGFGRYAITSFFGNKDK